MEQADNHDPSIPNEAETTQLAPATTATYDSVITDLLLDPPALNKIVDDNLLTETLCVAGDDFVQSLVDVVNQSIPGLDCTTKEKKDCDYSLQSQPDIPSDELNLESENIKDNEVSQDADENGDESDEEPAVKKRRRIVILANDDDDDDSDAVDEECQSPADIPIVVDSAELNDEHETPKPKCKKASTIMLKEIQARVLLESAVMIPADTSCRKKKNRILDSDEDEDVSGANDMVINDVSDIGLGSNDEATENVNTVDVRCNEIRGGEDDNLVMIQEEVFISQQENNLDIGTEMETCKVEYIEPDESQNSSEDDNSMHSNVYESPVDETQGPMAGLFETDPSDSSQGEEIFGHDPQSEKEFMTTSDVEESRQINDSDNDRSSSSGPTVTENFCCGESDVEEGEIRLNYLRHKLRLISSSDDDSWKIKPKPQSPTVLDEKNDCETGEVKLVDLPSIKIIDVKTINEIVNSVDSSYNNNNLEDSNLHNDDHSNNANNNNKHSSKRSSKPRSKNKTNRDPFDYSTTSSSDDFIPNEIYFGSPDLLARHQRRKARRKESRRNKHKHKSRTNSHEPSSSSAEDTDSMDGRYSKKYLSHHNRNKANTKNNKRKKRKDDRFYDRSRDIPSDVYFGDVQVPLHVLHSYGATSNSNSGPSDSDVSANRKNKNTNRAGRSQRGHVNNNNNRKSAAASSRTRRYSSSSSMSTVNSIISPSRDNMIETMKRYLKAAGIMRQIKLNRLWEGCKSNKERADKILEVLREKGLEGEPTMAKCKELKIRLQTKKELEELNPNVIIVTEGRARRSTTRAATEKSLQTNPLEFSTTSAENEPQPNPTADPDTDSAAAVAPAVDAPNPVECSTALIKLNNIVDWDSD